MEIERVAASLLTVGLDGPSLSPELKQLLARGVSGVVLFRRNIESIQQVRELIAEIKRYARHPVHVAVDQEGGRVQRLREGLTRLPSMRALGACRSSTLARSFGSLIGRELSAIGIDLDFAPVVDVDTNPANPVIGDRALGSDAELVAELGAALITGMQAEGVAACAKHFPGHGDTHEDSHISLPVLAHDMERLERVELLPFMAALDAGVSSIMTAHVIYEPLDAEFPTTLSTRALPTLRSKLGFERLLFSDDLQMSAIRAHFGLEFASVRAVNAGVDQLLCCHDNEGMHTCIDTLIKAIEAGRLSRARVHEAAERLDVFRRAFVKPSDSADLSILESDAHRRFAESLIARIARQAPALASEPDSHDPTAGT